LSCWATDDPSGHNTTQIQTFTGYFQLSNFVRPIMSAMSVEWAGASATRPANLSEGWCFENARSQLAYLSMTERNRGHTLRAGAGGHHRRDRDARPERDALGLRKPNSTLQPLLMPLWSAILT
jgi:hypothetical protein